LQVVGWYTSDHVCLDALDCTWLPAAVQVQAGVYVCVIGKLRASQAKSMPGQQEVASRKLIIYVLAHKVRWPLQAEFALSSA